MNLTDFLKMNGDVYMLGVEHIISEHSDEYVHHFVLSGYEVNGQLAELYAWAPGVQALVTVPYCGFLLSDIDPNGVNFLVLQTHYDNIEKKEGYHDTSGVKIYYKKKSSYTETP